MVSDSLAGQAQENPHRPLMLWLGGLPRWTRRLCTSCLHEQFCLQDRRMDRFAPEPAYRLRSEGVAELWSPRRGTAGLLQSPPPEWGQGAHWTTRCGSPPERSLRPLSLKELFAQIHTPGTAASAAGLCGPSAYAAQDTWDKKPGYSSGPIVPPRLFHAAGAYRRRTSRKYRRRNDQTEGARDFISRIRAFGQGFAKVSYMGRELTEPVEATAPSSATESARYWIALWICGNYSLIFSFGAMGTKLSRGVGQEGP